MSSIGEIITHYQKSIDRSLDNEQRLLHCINRLYRLPISVQHLQETGIGRTINGLRRNDGEVGTAAKALVTKWKRMVASEEDEEEDQEDGGGGGGGGDVQRQTDDHRRGSRGSDREGEQRQQQSRDRHRDSSNNREDHRGREEHFVGFMRHHEVAPDENELDQDDIYEEKPLQVDEQFYDGQGEEEEEEDDEPVNYEDKQRQSSREESEEEEARTEQDDEEDTVPNGYHHQQSDSDRETDRVSASGDRNREKSSRKSDTESSSSRSKSKDQAHSKSESSSSRSSHSSKESSSSKSKSRDEGRKSSLSSSSKKSSRHDKDRDRKDKHASSGSSRKESSHSKEKESSHNATSSSSSSNYSSRKDKDSSSKHHSSSSKGSSSRHEKESYESKRQRSPEKSEEESAPKKIKKEESSKSSGKDKSGSSSKSSSSKDKNKKSDKSKESSSTRKSVKEIQSDEEVEGFNQSEGTSFDAVMAMMDMPSSSKKKLSVKSEKEKPSSSSMPPPAQKIKTDKQSPQSSKSREVRSPSTASSSSGYSSSSSSSTPSLLKQKVKLEPLPDVSEIVETLPTISPNYRPMPLNQVVMDCVFSNNGKPQKRPLTEEEALGQSMQSKNLRTKVFSGHKTFTGVVPSLYDLCIRLLQENIELLDGTGGIPFDMLKPVLERASAKQLEYLEEQNPYLLEDSDILWEQHCKRLFRSQKRKEEECESWREMYFRCSQEQAVKLHRLTANIKMAQVEQTASVRRSQLAYVDATLVKPPRQVISKQIKYGTAKAPVVSPAARVASLKSVSANVATAGDSRLKVAPTARDNAQVQVFAPTKPKKAPLMAKLMTSIKGFKTGFRR